MISLFFGTLFWISVVLEIFCFTHKAETITKVGWTFLAVISGTIWLVCFLSKKYGNTGNKLDGVNLDFGEIEYEELVE